MILTTTTARTAIATKFLVSPTGKQRVAVWRADMNYQDDPDRMRVDWDYQLELRGNHLAAIDAYLAAKKNHGNDWTEGGTWVAGTTASGVVAVFVTT